MPRKTIETIPQVIAELRAMSAQIICPKDTYFASMAQTVENFVALTEHEETVVDDLVATVDRLQAALIAIANDRNEFDGPSLDYMQGYRDGQEHLAKMAREAIKPPVAV